MMIEVYAQCNQSDLKLLEEMGISPDISIREKRPSLRTVGLAVVAGLRMRRLGKEWAGSRKVHGEIVRKLEGMRGRKRGGEVVKGMGKVVR